jgi:hypothetical protein
MSDSTQPNFAFAMRSQVEVTLAGRRYVGKVISRLESHTAGLSYAVYADYHHGQGAEWFMEREVHAASGQLTMPAVAAG